MAESKFVCPECERVFETAARLGAHRRMAPDHARQPKKDAPQKLALDPNAILDAAVENLRNDAALIAAFAPHLGVTLHGVQIEEGPDKGKWLVESRALLVGKLLRARVQKDLRLVAFLAAFNRLHETPDALKLGGGLIAAVAVDTGRVAPDVTIEIPIMGRKLPIQPVKAIIGDVVDFVAAETSSQPAAAEPVNGRARQPQAQTVEGGVEAT